MNYFSDPKQELIWHIAGLLPTVGEALNHMVQQLDELRLEESASLFQDAAKGIGVIADKLPMFLNENNSEDLLKSTAELRGALVDMSNEYHTRQLLAIQNCLVYRLLPTFDEWGLEVETLLKQAGMQ